MKFSIQVTSGEEVVFAGHSQRDRTVYYGGPPPATGLWRVSLPKFEEFLATELASQSFGSSIEEFRFGFEIAELDEWGNCFSSMANYMSYRPKGKEFISVGQLEWRAVKDLTASEQLARLGDVLILAVERIATAKKKPRDFDHAALAQALRRTLGRCEPSLVSAHE